MEQRMQCAECAEHSDVIFEDGLYFDWSSKTDESIDIDIASAADAAINNRERLADNELLRDSVASDITKIIRTKLVGCSNQARLDVLHLAATQIVGVRAHAAYCHLIAKLHDGADSVSELSDIINGGLLASREEITDIARLLGEISIHTESK